VPTFSVDVLLRYSKTALPHKNNHGAPNHFCPFISILKAHGNEWALSFLPIHFHFKSVSEMNGQK
jgi:hypothetical protein